MRDKSRWLVIALVVSGACHPTRGCVSSKFTLAGESRIPMWFLPPSDYARADLIVTMDYWSGPGGRTATVTLRTAEGRQLDSLVATKVGNEPHTLVRQPQNGPISYPMYELLTAKGITEVIEHRQMEPIFYIVDDSEVRRKLGVQ